MRRLRKIRLSLALLGMLGALMPARLIAQQDSSLAPSDDPNDAPLGDVARNLRKKTPPSQGVIDDDNLTKVMEQAESRHTTGSALRFLMAGEGKSFQISAPDVTCSLAFTANVKSLLSSQYAQMDLPGSDVVKLEGPATIEGDTLIVSVYNRTDWHVSELAVALTIVKKNGAREASMPVSATAYGATLQPAVAAYATQEEEVRPEKTPDETVIYRMRAAAPPSSTAVFSARLGRDLAADEEWHWAIVQARGYPPQSYGHNPSSAKDCSI